MRTNVTMNLSFNGDSRRGTGLCSFQFAQSCGHRNTKETYYFPAGTGQTWDSAEWLSYTLTETHTGL